MQYQIINDEFCDKNNLVKNILTRRGIKNIKSFYNLDKHNIEDYHNYDNLPEGYNLLMANINELIGILIDPDVDGITSSGFTYQYIKDINPNANIVYFFQDKKQHGLDNDKIMQQILKSKIKLLICPDGASNNYKEHKELNEKGILILVLDHHDSKFYSQDAIVINNQLSSKVRNKEFSGVGVVFKFFQYVDERNNTNYAIKYLDLLSLGLCADSMDFRELETRYYFFEGIKSENIRNELIKEMIQKYDCGNHINPTIIGWSIAPKINATNRFGKPKEKKDMFRAMIGEQEDIEYQPRRKNKEDEKPPIEIHSLQKTMARVMENIKQRQDKKVKEGLQKIKEVIAEKKIHENKIIIVNTTEILDNEFTGLVANKLINIYKRPVILLNKRKPKSNKNQKSILSVNEKEEILYGGSARSPQGFFENGFKDYLTNTKFFEMCEGHPDAFGISIKEEKIQELLKYLKTQLLNKTIQEDDIYDVDYEFSVYDLNNKQIKLIADLEDTWGNKIDEPLFAITDVIVKRKEIKEYGENRKILKFSSNGIDFIHFYVSQEIIDKINMKPEKGFNKVKEIDLKIIGKFKNNLYNDNIYQQIEIVDFNVKSHSLIEKTKTELEEKSETNKEIEDEINLIDIDW